MATAVCTQCDQHWHWRARRGTRLANLKCTDCGGRLRMRRYEAPYNDADRHAPDLGTSVPERMIALQVEIAENDKGFYRTRAEAELARLRDQYPEEGMVWERLRCSACNDTFSVLRPGQHEKDVTCRHCGARYHFDGTRWNY